MIFAVSAICYGYAPSVFGAKSGIIALVQYDADSTFADYDLHIKDLTRLALASVGNGANIIVFPEGSTWGYGTNQDIWIRPDWDFYLRHKSLKQRTPRDVSPVAESLGDGKTVHYWREFAREHNVVVIFSIIERSGNQYFNALVAVHPDGRTQSYRKRDLYLVDKAYAKAGEGPVVVETRFGRFGLMICMDGQDYGHHLYQEYLGLGVDAIIIAMDWDDPPTDPVLSAQAVFARKAQENKVTLFASDNAKWDGTGKYEAGTGKFARDGLPFSAVGQAGISYHLLR